MIEEMAIFFKQTIYFLLLSLGFGFLLSCVHQKTDEMVICTQVPVNNFIDSTTSVNLYPAEARLVAFSLNDAQNTFHILSKNFYSACSPDAFFTGKTIIFSAQKIKGDTWQIWEMNLKNFKTKQITFENFNCTNPLYLPTGEIIFSRETQLKGMTGHALYMCQSDGSNIQQITFHPHTDLFSSILLDGRILNASQQLLPNKGEQKLMVMRPDGTKSELFYQGEPGVKLLCRARETVDKKIVFVQSHLSKSISGQLISVDYNNPFHSKKKLTEADLELLSVFPIVIDKYLVAAKQQSTNSFGIMLFNKNTNSIEKTIYKDPAYHTFEPVMNQVKERARKLPSAVNLHEKTGLILCQNIHVSSLASQAEPDQNSPVKIELIGLDKKLAVVEAEEDGSLYLKVKSDTPFRFRVVNNKGDIVRGPSDWLWVRPNERRGCVGCHADREMVPKNLVPLAVKKLPLSVTVKSIERKETRQ